jgi:hypothetical protein
MNAETLTQVRELHRTADVNKQTGPGIENGPDVATGTNISQTDNGTAHVNRSWRGRPSVETGTKIEITISLNTKT